MAWRRASSERQIAERFVNRFLEKRVRYGKKTNGFLALFTVLLAVFGLIWTANAPKKGDVDEDGVSATEEDANGNTGEQFFPEAVAVSSQPLSESRFSVPEWERVTIERCVDGDTLIVITTSGARERVRLIGVDTPETVKSNWPIEPFGPEASEYTKLRVEETGGVATLVADGSAYDRYNRRLAFVYLGDENFSLNEDLCRQGLARVETQYSFSSKMKSRLVAAAAAAESERIGIYSLSE